MAFTKIKFQVLQVRIQCTKPSDQEVIHLILTMTLFMILLHFVMIGQPREFIDRSFFKIFHHSLLVYFYCYLDVCYSVSSLISSLHLWSIIFWCGTTQRKQISTFSFVKVLKSYLYKSIGIAIILQNFNTNCSSHFCSNVSYNFTKILSYILFYVISCHSPYYSLSNSLFVICSTVLYKQLFLLKFSLINAAIYVLEKQLFIQCSLFM